MADAIENDMALVREIMARELETVNTYFALLQKATNSAVRQFIEHIMNEEKEHIAEAVDILSRFDRVQATMLQKDFMSHTGAEHAQGGPTAQTSGRGANNSHLLERKLTVGSLRKTQ